MLHPWSRRRRTAIAGTAILAAMAVLTFAASHGGAENISISHRSVADASFADMSFADWAKALFWESYRVAPVLVLGLVVAAVVPLLSASVKLSKPLTRCRNATLLYRPGRGDAFDATVDAHRNARSRHPFIEIENGRGMRCAILRDMLRIGREDDNDIRIPSRYVHRYHAAIHREDYDDWHITDLTGVESNGLIVNGKRCCEARLHDGDLIQLGPGKLRFRAGAG